MTGWRNIGRKLRVALVGPDEERLWLAEKLGREVEVYDGLAAGIGQLDPETVDAVIVIDGDRDGVDAADIARRIRRNFVGTVLVVREPRARILEEQLGLILGDELEAAKLDDTVSVAAQTTWALSRLSPRMVPTERVRPVRARKPPPDEAPTDETTTDRSKALRPSVTREVLAEDVLEAVAVDFDEKTPVLFESATRPFSPTGDMLAALAIDDGEALAIAETTKAERRPSSASRAADGSGHPAWRAPVPRDLSASVLFTGSILLPPDEEGGTPLVDIVDPERPIAPPRAAASAERSIAPDATLYPEAAPKVPLIPPARRSGRLVWWIALAGLALVAVTLLFEVLS